MSDQKDARAECKSAITQPSESKQHVGSKKHVTWAKQDGAELTDSTQGVNKKKKKQLVNQEKPKQMFYRQKTNISEPQPVAAEEAKENNEKISQLRKAQE